MSRPVRRGESQCCEAHDSSVSDPRDVDDALDLAIDRTKDAQDKFDSIPVTRPEALPAADKVVHRAEDVNSLAGEAETPMRPEARPSSVTGPPDRT
jgi:hypothetical protein